MTKHGRDFPARAGLGGRLRRMLAGASAVAVSAVGLATAGAALTAAPAAALSPLQQCKGTLTTSYVYVSGTFSHTRWETGYNDNVPVIGPAGVTTIRSGNLGNEKIMINACKPTGSSSFSLYQSVVTQGNIDLDVTEHTSSSGVRTVKLTPAHPDAEGGPDGYGVFVKSVTSTAVTAEAVQCEPNPPSIAGIIKTLGLIPLPVPYLAGAAQSLADFLIQDGGTGYTCSEYTPDVTMPLTIDKNGVAHLGGPHVWRGNLDAEPYLPCGWTSCLIDDSHDMWIQPWKQALGKNTNAVLQGIASPVGSPDPSQPSIYCQSCNDSGVQVGDGGVLAATSTDPNGKKLNYTFRVYLNEEPFPLAAQGTASNVPSGISGQWAIPPGSLTSGHDYSFVVDVNNGSVWGTSSLFDVFTYQAEAPPGQPTIGCFTCNAATVSAGDGGELSAQATDPNDDDISYQFRLISNTPGFPQVASGWVSGPSGATVVWQMPSGLKPGSYAYVVDVVDSRGVQGQSSNFGYFTQENEVAPNEPSTISCVSCVNNAAQYGGTTTLSATATDPNGDDVNYQFRVIANIPGFPQVASGWVAGPSGTPVQYQIPAGVLQPGTPYAYVVDVTDGVLQGTSSWFGYFNYSNGAQVRGTPTTDESTGSRNYLSINAPTGTSAGDLLVANVTVTNDSTATAPTGWTVLSGWPRTDGTQTWSAKQYVFTHRVVSGETGPYRFATNGPGGYVAAAGEIVAVSGVSTTAPLVSSWAQLPAGASLSVTSPAITAGSVELGLTAVTNGWTTPTTTSVSSPMTNHVDVTEAHRDAGVDVAAGAAVGTSPTVTYTFSQNSQAVATILELPAA
jgi:hypothetical protein